MISVFNIVPAGKQKERRKLYPVKDLIGEDYLAGKGPTIDPGHYVEVDGVQGRVTSLVKRAGEAFAWLHFRGEWKDDKRLGVLQSFTGDNWTVRPEIAMSGRSRCKDCGRKIPKGALRYVCKEKRLRWWTMELVCAPCALADLDRDYKKFQQQLRSLRRRLDPYMPDYLQYKEIKAASDKLGVDTKKKPNTRTAAEAVRRRIEQEWFIPYAEGHRRDGDRYLERKIK